jgi:hypothetical protein
MIKIYTASKTIHAPKWRELRVLGFPIISTWIDEAGKGETQSFTDLWMRCINEASQANITLCYREPNETLKGAFIEVGASLASNRSVFAIGCEEFSFVAHSNVTQYKTLGQALKVIGYLKNA